MKKVLFGLLAVSASAAVASVTQTVASVSMTAIDSGLSNTVIAVSALDLGGGNVTISNLVKTTNLSAGDKLYAFDGSKYACWVLSSGTPKVWEKADKAFTISAEGVSESETSSPALTTMAVGKGIWLSRKVFAKGTKFYIYGAFTNATTSVVAAGKTAELVGNPTLLDRRPTSVTGAVKGDVIAVPQNGALRKYYYNGSSWGIPLTEEATLPAIPAGTGFWYIPKNKQAVTINWPTE